MEKRENKWSAAEILEEAIACEKHLTTLYNSAANEASSDKIYKDFMQILTDEHQLHRDILNIRQCRGLNGPQLAESTEIARTWQDYNK